MLLDGSTINWLGKLWGGGRIRVWGPGGSLRGVLGSFLVKMLIFSILKVVRERG